MSAAFTITIALTNGDVATLREADMEHLLTPEAMQDWVQGLVNYAIESVAETYAANDEEEA